MDLWLCRLFSGDGELALLGLLDRLVEFLIVLFDMILYLLLVLEMGLPLLVHLTTWHWLVEHLGHLFLDTLALVLRCLILIGHLFLNELHEHSHLGIGRGGVIVLEVWEARGLLLSLHLNLRLCSFWLDCFFRFDEGQGLVVDLHGLVFFVFLNLSKLPQSFPSILSMMPHSSL